MTTHLDSRERSHEVGPRGMRCVRPTAFGSEDDSRGVDSVVLGLRSQSPRTRTVTALADVGGMLPVAGPSNGEAASTPRRVPLPSSGGAQTDSLRSFHARAGSARSTRGWARSSPMVARRACSRRTRAPRSSTCRSPISISGRRPDCTRSRSSGQ